MDSLNSNTNRDRLFKGQHPNEEFICFFRHHWIVILKEFVLFSIFIAIVVYSIVEIDTIKSVLRGNRELKLFFYTGFLMGTVYMHRFFLKLLNYFVNIGIITNIRVIDHQKTLFFTDNLDSIDMAQIQNVEKLQEGIFSNLLGYGDIKVFLTASDTVKTFRKIPNSKFHFRCLNRAREARQNQLDRGPGNLRYQNEFLQPSLQTTFKTPTID